MSKINHLKKIFGHKCYYCGGRARYDATVEHLIPVSQYRIDGDCNCRIAHYSCNQIRGTLYQQINNTFQRLSNVPNKKSRNKSKIAIQFCIKHLTKQDGLWTYSYFDELQFTVEHPHFVQDMLNGVFNNLFFRRKSDVKPT